MMRVLTVPSLLGAGLFLLVAAVSPTAADDAELGDGGKVFVQEMASKAIESLTVPDLDRIERRDRFRAMMLEYFAFKGIAKWVMGRYWRRASVEQREEYLKLFEDLMVVSYADRFEKYAGETLEVRRAEVRGGKDILVHSRLTRPEGSKPVEVSWRLRRKEDTFKVVDVMVEGLSMGLTQQKEFTSVIRQNDGQVESLLMELRRRLSENS